MAARAASHGSTLRQTGEATGEPGRHTVRRMWDLGVLGTVSWAVGQLLPLAALGCAQCQDTAVCGPYPWGDTQQGLSVQVPLGCLPQSMPSPAEPQGAERG